MTYRVIQWATGNVGRAAIEGVVGHPDLELVGAYVYSPAKAGLDVGDICGREPVGVTATDDRDAILALDADCVVYSPMLADQDDVVAILGSGKNLVTPVGWVYPFKSHDVVAVEAACRAAGVSLHGSGINPGGITEQIPLLLSAFCRDIRHVRAEEFSDIRTYDTAFVVRDVMLFGQSPELAASSPMLGLLGDGFCQSIDMVADGLGVTLDRREAHHPRDGGDHRGTGHAGRDHRGRHRGRPALHLAGAGGRPGVHDRSGELADGRGPPGASLDLRTRG